MYCTISNFVGFVDYCNCAGAGARAVIPHTLKMGARAGAAPHTKMGCAVVH